MEEEILSVNENKDESLRVKIENFEGPLDLLLHLIKESKVSIVDVKIAEITEQYLSYLENLGFTYDMEQTTDFLAVATILLEIKSKSLLPQEIIEEPYEDLEEKLRLQLLEYQLFKDAAENLKQYENVDRLYKTQEKSATNSRIIFKDFNYDGLLDAFAMLLSRAKNTAKATETKTIKKDRWTVAEKIDFLRTVLKDNEYINFFGLFDDNYSKMEIITVFLAILELLKFQEIEVVQAKKYEDIVIKRKEAQNGNE